MAKIDDIRADRQKLMSEVGVDAFSQSPDTWLSIAVAAEARGEFRYQRDCERAMDISNRRYGATHG